MREGAPAWESPRSNSRITLHEHGLMVGNDLALIRLVKGDLAIAEDGERCLALLSVLDRRPIDADVLLHFEAAAAYLRRGDKALANLRLAFARLPAISNPFDLQRLRFANELFARGITPRQLMRELALDSSALDILAKYSPDQPRVPAGNGRASGQFGSNSGDQALLSVPGATTGFLEGAGPEIVGALTRLASSFSVPTAVLGALFIPTPNSGGVTEGTLPDSPDVAFKNDGPAGVLTLKTAADGGPEVTVTARNENGIFVDVRSGQQIGRNLGGSLFLALDAVHDVLEDARETHEDEGTKPKAAIDDDEPRLCPAPQKDTPHGSSEDAKNYEDDVHARVNPLAPIPREFAVHFTNPQTGESYFFDDCFRYAGDLIDGDMQRGDFADAKSARFGFLLLNPKTRAGVLATFENAAARQTAAVKGTSRRIKWYFGSEFAAKQIRDTIGKSYGITVAYMPPRRRQ